MANFWGNGTKLDFHKAVAELQDLTRYPVDEEYYRPKEIAETDGRVLKFKDELQLADDLAFLANSEEGVGTVSAVTIQERREGITVLLASNYTPTETTVKGLRNILDIIQKYAFKGINMLFHYCVHTPGIAILLGKVDALLESLRPLENKSNALTENLYLDDIIKKSADLVALGGRGSLEKHLRCLGFSQDCIVRSGIPQVDKLARYFHSCKDLVRIVRQQTHSALFQGVTLKHLDAFPDVPRPGTAKQCFVHAEMQQVFYYEQHPDEPRPRAIGCSKSTCYLCDLFLKQQGLYRVSHSYKRLYSQWTLPDVDWMAQEQVDSFSLIVKFMTDHIRKTEEHLRWDPPVRPTRWSYDQESRAFTRLSSASSESDVQNERSTLASKVSSTKAPPSSVGSDGTLRSSAETLTELPCRVVWGDDRREGAISRAASRGPPDRASSRARSRAPSTMRERGVQRASRPPDLKTTTRDRAISRPPIPMSRPPILTQKRSRRSHDSSRPPLSPSSQPPSPPSTQLPPSPPSTQPTSPTTPPPRIQEESTSQRAQAQAQAAVRSVPSSTIRLRSDDLPYHHDVQENAPAIALEIDTILLIVEFPRRSAGRLFISRKDPAVVGQADVDAEQLPTDREVRLNRGNNNSGGGGGAAKASKKRPKSKSKSKLSPSSLSPFTFQLRHQTLTRLNIGFHWGGVA
ncbi:hypothetical protein SLS62_008044 [Diatrype stigma]|uniref:Uncharacterized protein n=1 Tax=Diatrype stigma TaxID=117547 RepID=A0AAN9YMZ1_9PEZI